MDETKNSTFPLRLKELMDEKGENQGQLASTIKKSRQTVSLYCSGGTSPDLDTLKMIADHYDKSIDWLCGREGYPEKLDLGKQAVMQTTGLSEEAVDGFLFACTFHAKAFEILLTAEHFEYVMQKLGEAIVIAKGNPLESYYLMPTVAHNQKDLEHPSKKDLTAQASKILRDSNGKPLMYSYYELDDYLISEAFDTLKEDLSEELWKKRNGLEE